MPRRVWSRVLAGTLGAAVATLPAACSSLAPDGEEAAATAVAFVEDVTSGDGGAACDLLAPRSSEQLVEDSGMPCAEAVTGDEVASSMPSGEAPTRTVAYGRAAQVLFDGEAVFLTSSGGVWLVTAAGCTPRPGRPYDCTVEGP